MAGKSDCQLDTDIFPGMNCSGIKKGRFAIGRGDVPTDCDEDNLPLLPCFTNTFNPDMLRVLLSQ